MLVPIENGLRKAPWGDKELTRVDEGRERGERRGEESMEATKGRALVLRILTARGIWRQGPSPDQ